VGIVEDAGISGKSLDRPGIQEVLSRVRAGGLDFVVVAKLDRLTRSLRDWCTLAEDYFADPRSTNLLSCSETFDLRTPGGELMANIMVAFAQNERKQTISRNAIVLEHKRARGERLGTVPYGFMLHEDGKTLAPCDGETAALYFMAARRRDGMTLREIARELDRAGFATRSGKPWASSTVAKLLNAAEPEDIDHAA
jgi:site-specific DNA recombinase